LNKIRKIIEEENSNILFLEEYFDKALIGMGRSCGKNIVAVYDADECIRILIKKFDMDELEALERFRQTVDFGQKGKYKPIFINDFRKIVDVNSLKIENRNSLKDFIS